MEIIKDSMWKYKLAFDNDLYKVVKRYSFGLPPKEKAQLTFEIDFFRTFYSIEQVINIFSLIKNKKKSVEAFKKVINKRLNFLLFCPIQLYSHYKDLINKKFSDENKTWLIKILNYAKDKGITILPKLYYKNIFGKQIYKHVYKKCISYSKRKTQFTKNTKIDVGKEKIYASNLIKKLEIDNFKNNIWGNYSTFKFIIKEDNEFGTGKWLDNRLTYSSNQFILNTNFILTEKCCEDQIYRNIYPGHAHFYNTIFSNKKLTKLDNSSSYIINGWSTFALWHFNPSNHIRNHKYNNCKTLTYMFGKKFDQNTVNKLFNHLLTYNNKKMAINILIQLTQYIGYFESSILGAIAVEYLIDKLKMGPKEFLKWLSNQHIGNFFEKYSFDIKKQK